MSNWNQRFMELALNVANWSKDRSTKTGAIIVDDNHRVVSIGYNGPPAGFPDELDYIHERPTKYLYFEHAERNAIYNASRNGISTVGCTIFINDNRNEDEHIFCCADCARAIVQSGIKKVVINKCDLTKENWVESNEAAINIFEKCNIKIEFYEIN